MLFYHGAHGLGGGGHQLLYQVVRKSGAQEWSGPVARLCQRRAAGYVLYCSSALMEIHLVVGRGIWPFRFKGKGSRKVPLLCLKQNGGFLVPLLGEAAL